MSETFAPLPWHDVPWHVEEGPAAVRCKEGWVVCCTSSDADAAFIARAANSHYEFLDALRSVDAMFSTPGAINKNTVRDKVRVALAKALPVTSREMDR